MTITIYENDAPAGSLQITRQGLYTLFEARLSAPQRTTVDRPASDRASDSAAARCAALRRRPPDPEAPLTRLWLSDGAGGFAPLGLLEPRGEERLFRRRLTRLDLRALPARPAFALALPDGERPAPALLPRRATGSGDPPEPPRPAFRVPLSESSWTPRPDGTLVDPVRRLIALPCALRDQPSGLRKISLRGREYLVFRY